MSNMEDENYIGCSKVKRNAEDSVNSASEDECSEEELLLFNSSPENDVPITPLNQFHEERRLPPPPGSRSLPSSKKKKKSRKRIEFIAEQIYDPKQDIFGDDPELNEGDDSFHWDGENSKAINSVNELEPSVKDLHSAKNCLVDISDTSFVTPKRTRKSLVNQKSVSCDKNKCTPTTIKQTSKSERKKTLESHSRTNIDTIKVIMDGYKTLKDVWKRTENLSVKTFRSTPAKTNCSSNINGIVPLTDSPISTSQHCHSKVRNINNCRKVLIRSCNQGSSPILLSYEEEDVDFSPTQPVSTLILKGVNAYVEVRSAGDNRSMGVKAQLLKLGATVSDKFSKEVTHVIFNEGLPSTYKKAIKRNIPIVSVLWIEECKKANVKVSERLFPPHDKEIYESPNPLKKFRKMKSIQPDFDGKCEKNANRKSVKRKSSPTDDGTEDGLYEQKRKRKKSNGSGKKWVANTFKDNVLAETIVNITGIRQKEYKKHVSSPLNSFPEDVANSPLAVRLLRQLTSPCLSREMSPKFRTPSTESKRRKSASPMQTLSEFEEASFNTPVKTGTGLVCNGMLPTEDRNIKLPDCHQEISLPKLQIDDYDTLSTTEKNANIPDSCEEISFHKIQTNNHLSVENGLVIQDAECSESKLGNCSAKENTHDSKSDCILAAKNKVALEGKVKEIISPEYLTKNQQNNTSLVTETLSGSFPIANPSVKTTFIAVNTQLPIQVGKKTGNSLLNESKCEDAHVENESSVVQLSDNDSSLPFCNFVISDNKKQKSDDEFSQCDDGFDVPTVAIEECINAISEDSNGENKKSFNSHQMEVNTQFSTNLTDTSDSMKSMSKRKLLNQTHLCSSEVFTVVNQVKPSPTPHYVRFRKRASSDPSVQKNKRKIQESVTSIRPSCSEPEIFKKSTSRRDTLDLTTLWKQKKIQTKVATEQQLPTIVCTSLHKTDLDAVISVISKLGSFAIEDKVSPLTTHVVASGPKRTINMLRGIARGCWILRLEWVYKSLEAEKWLDEELFEMTEFSSAVKKCRIERESFGPVYKNDLFASCGTIFISRNTCPPKVDLEELVRLCGGKVVSAARSADVVVGVPCNTRDVKCVSEKWILDSITHNALGSITEYLLNCNPR